MSILRNLNQSQRRVIVVGASILGVMLLFPPFHFINSRGVQLNLGYSWLFSPPLVDGRYAASVNIALLLVQWLAVAVISAVALLLLRSPSDSSPSAQSLQGTGIVGSKATGLPSTAPRSAFALAKRNAWYCFLFFLSVLAVRAVLHLTTGHAPQPTWVDFILKNLIAIVFVTLIAFVTSWLWAKVFRKTRA